MMPLLQAALVYAARGWPVFPCSPNDKLPLVGESAPGNRDAGLYRATTDEAQIHAWWSEFKSAMIGVPTGARLGAFVIDIDPKDDTTPAQIVEALEEAIGVQLPPTPMVQTPRGGWHLYFRMPESGDIPNRTGMIPYVDVRGTGGYVIAPPSIRLGGKAKLENCAGVAYAWLGDDAIEGFDPPLPPPELVDLILRRGKFATGPGPDGASRLGTHRYPSPNPDDKIRAYALRAFDSELAKVRAAPDGTRNNTLNEAAFALGQLIGANTLDEAMVTAALEGIAANWPEFKKSQGTIQSGLRAGKTQPRDLSGITVLPWEPPAHHSARRTSGGGKGGVEVDADDDEEPPVPHHDPEAIVVCAALPYNDEERR